VRNKINVICANPDCNNRVEENKKYRKETFCSKCIKVSLKKRLKWLKIKILGY